MRAVGIESEDIASVLNVVFRVANGDGHRLRLRILARVLHDRAYFSSVMAELSNAIDSRMPVHELPEHPDTCEQLDVVFHKFLRPSLPPWRCGTWQLTCTLLERHYTRGPRQWSVPVSSLQRGGVGSECLTI
jgi:hypothetical protein